MKYFLSPEFVKNQNHKILTPIGYEDFLGVNRIIKDRYIHLKFSNGKELKCSEDHPLLTINGVVKAKDINKKIEIESIDGGCFVKSKRTVKKKITLFDIINSGKDNLYITNGIISHNCEFLGSTNTLVSGEKIACLAYKEPIKEISEAVVYEEPILEAYDEETGNLKNKDHQYVILVDVSEGKNLDYSAFSVIDISTMPYRQAAVYRSNSIPPILLPSIIKAVAEYYNNAFVLVEINNTPQVADILTEELGYENVFRVKSGNKKAQQISLEWGKNTATGVKMTALVKRIGCAMLKTLIESDKLIINDFETISELTTFVQEGNSYQAEEGRNDDLVMSLVIFGWLCTQKIFKDILEHDLRKQLQLEKFEVVDDNVLPIIGIQTGKEIEHSFEDGVLWISGSSKNILDDFYKETVLDNYSQITLF